MNFDQLINLNSVILLMLVIFRVAGTFVAAPLLSNTSVALNIKVIFCVVVSLLLFSTVPQVKVDNLATNVVSMSLAVVSEMTIGFTLGFVSSVVFSTVQSAGEIFGMQLGYGAATIFDPTNEDSTGVISSFYTIIGALLFLYLDGHHLILVALSRSFEFLPIAHPFNMKIGASMGDLVTQIMVVAIQMAAPVLVVVTLLNFIFGLIGKLSPQMNLFMNTGFILGPVVGTVALMVTLPLFRVLLTQMTEQLGPQLSQTIHQLKVP